MCWVTESVELENILAAWQNRHSPRLSGPLLVSIIQWWADATHSALVCEDAIETADVLVRDPLLVFGKVEILFPAAPE